jgi:hypothetical protein
MLQIFTNQHRIINVILKNKMTTIPAIGSWIQIQNEESIIAPDMSKPVEQVYNLNQRVPVSNLFIIVGYYEAGTDQYNKTSVYTENCNLTVKNGILDLAEDDKYIAICMGIDTKNNILLFKRRI